MFENYTFEYLMEKMLSNAPNDMDKRQGSVIYDMLAPAALEMSELYQALDMVLNEGFADTASYYYLLKRGAERGIKIQEATSAIWKCVIYPESVELNTGQRFSNGEFNFFITEKISDGIYKLQCEITGISGNNTESNLIPLDYVEGLESVSLVELLVPGEEEESEEDYRERYYGSINAQTFGGNVADYKKWTEEMQGVGAVKIHPVWNGGGTVKVVVMNSEYEKPSEELISSIQTALDPIQNSGDGIGIAPIGHKVTVVGVEESKINVNTKLTFKSGYDFEGIKSSLESALENYLQTLRESWKSVDLIVVRISQIENAFLQVDGVLDIAKTQINSEEENLILPTDMIPVRGEISERIS